VVLVVFEIHYLEDPASLEYAPWGPIALGPFGGKVRYEFYR
jgi:hypothetical protein